VAAVHGPCGSGEVDSTVARVSFLGKEKGASKVVYPKGKASVWGAGESGAAVATGMRCQGRGKGEGEGWAALIYEGRRVPGGGRRGGEGGGRGREAMVGEY